MSRLIDEMIYKAEDTHTAEGMTAEKNKVEGAIFVSSAKKREHGDHQD